jgi:type I restriction enzyme, S subunit
MSGLPPGWVWTDTGTVTEVQGGIQKQPKRRPTVHHYPFLRVANVMRGRLDLREVHEIELFDGELEKFRLRVGDLLVVEGNGSPGQIGRAACWHGDIEDCVHQNHLIRVRPSEAIDSRYLTHYWNASRTTEYLRSVASSTSGLYVLTTAKVRSVSIPLPPLGEQRRLVAAIEEQFSRLDAGVAALERARQNLKLMRSALLQKLVAGGLILDPDNGTNRETELPQLAEGWYWTTLGDLIANGPQNGLYLPASQYGHGVPILRINDFQSDWVRPREDLKLVSADPEQTKAFALAAGDLVINRVNSMTHLGKCMIVREDLAGALFESNMMRIRLTSDIEGSYVELYLRSSLGRSFLLKNAKWAVNQASINQADVRATPIAMPSPEEQKRIISAYEIGIKSLMRITDDIQLNLRRSTSLRSSILAAAFSGRLVTQDADEEPSSALLERIAAERTSSTSHKPGRSRKLQGVQEEVTT